MCIPSISTGTNNDDNDNDFQPQVLGMFIMPGVIALIMVFSRQTKMAELYGIRDNEMGYYLAFACVIIPFSLIMDVFVLNTQEVNRLTSVASHRASLGAFGFQEICRYQGQNRPTYPTWLSSLVQKSCCVAPFADR